MSFQLGVFLPSTRGGSILAHTSPPQTMPTWELNRTITQTAERAGFDFVLSQSKWRGYGGKSKHWDYALESFTLMSALAAATSTIQLYASIGIRTMPPAIVAKMASTIDEISGGRFGINIVAGWNQFEYAQMGLWAEDEYFKYRFQYAEEYLAVLQELWRTGRGNFKGKFFEIKDCVSLPTPKRKMPIVCAGQSDEALQFTAKYADYSFIGRLRDTPEQLGAVAKKVAEMGNAQGRKVGAYGLLNVIAEKTEKEAIEKRDYFIANADHEAIAEWMRASGRDATRSYDDLTEVQKTFMAFPFLATSYENVARHLDAVAEQGLAGMCFIFPDYAADLPRLIKHVLPLMKNWKAVRTAVPA